MDIMKSRTLNPEEILLAFEERRRKTPPLLSGIIKVSIKYFEYLAFKEPY
jgi:hypothetical protein